MKKNTYQTLWVKNISKEVIYNFWQQFQEDKLNKILFFDGEMQDFTEFYTWLLAKDKDVRFVANTEGVIKAMYWLNNPLGKSVMIHFCFLKKAFQEQEAIGFYVVKSLLLCRDSKQNYVLSALIGITPKPYRHALQFIKKLGFEQKAEIPELCYFARKNKYITGIVSVLQKEQITKVFD